MAKNRGKDMWTPERIVRLRKAFDENQQEFAERIGVSIDTLQNWEQARVQAPRMAGKLFGFLQEQLDEARKQPA